METPVRRLSPPGGPARAHPESEVGRSSVALEPVDLEQARQDANALLASGAGIGLLGALGFALGGAACPLCVVAAPALLGLGAVKRWKTRRL